MFDSYQNSLVFIKSTNGYVFGSCNQQSWSYTRGFKADQNAFLFRFINKHNIKLIMKCTAPYFAIQTSRGNGPIFGSDDLYICNNSNTSNECRSDLGHSYKHPNYAHGSNEAKSFLAGSDVHFSR